MSSKKFYKLTLWEWSLWVQRILYLQNQRNQDRWLLIELERNSNALFANAHKDKNTEAYTGADFYLLPGDVIEKKKQIFSSAKELEEEMKKRIRSIRNKRLN
jgi:hypothetical protein